MAVTNTTGYSSGCKTVQHRITEGGKHILFIGYILFYLLLSVVIAINKYLPYLVIYFYSCYYICNFLNSIYVLLQ